MKINETGRISGTNPYRKNEMRTNSIGGKQRQTDQVQISEEAKELLDAQQSSEASMKSEKIQLLKQHVSSGTYHVDAKKIAEKLLPYLK
ncbi:flagellar biosynthesis anti-sigma factor FlgM [Paenibacillus sp. CGMCC 1.16610]|uniref:Negative regulator of flagellin synthesis n=1 Tax=Paenibacillus anseongense TaxID=2682845 RepID=A0ABW9U338_9BACL|nr:MULTISPECIES: flagellar biosynthesis anti-sigma factor FlgM [Paenibacillus]MBA2942412.1 flagellar biosynthesis anti-sigma factor FlgM [Paenibacillus sp. CGMCC 1.16610]MVQ34487.1 flagellar biosynthesis anti-sigma factor FlgM [Paenibacillus anseongense]